MSRRPLPFESDVPPAERPPVDAVVALGANLGDRAATLAAAIEEIGRMPLTSAVHASDPIETTAVGPDGPDVDAPRYLNAVAIITTRLAPEVLLGYLQAIEERHGRERATPRDIRVVGSDDRTLDLDLIAYGDLVQDGDRLTLPHPRAASRDFVLGPWLTLDPDAVLPGRGRVVDLLDGLTDDGLDAGKGGGGIVAAGGDGPDGDGPDAGKGDRRVDAAGGDGPDGDGPDIPADDRRAGQMADVDDDPGGAP